MESVEKIWKKKHKLFYRVRRALDRGTRQTPSLPCAQGQAHGKGPSLPCVTLDTRQSWRPSGAVWRLDGRRKFAVCLTLAHGKHWRPWGRVTVEPRAWRQSRVRGTWFMFVVCLRFDTRRRARFAVCLVFAVCFLADARQIICLPCARKNAHGKDSGTRRISVFR